MSLQEELKQSLQGKAPSAHVYQNLSLDSQRGKGRKADLLVLHKTGIYLVLCREYTGFVYGKKTAKYWVQRDEEGKGDYFPNPVLEAEQAVAALEKKCRGISAYIHPVVVHGDNDRIVDMDVSSDDLTFCSKDFFLATFMLREFEKELIDPATRDTFIKQFTMLQMLSK